MVAPDTPKSTVKFLCSYGGKILPRYPDGKLRYLGGHTRILAVDRSIPFSDLLVKLGELCGSAVSLRCQLPNEDLDALVSITSDEDLANIIEEYDRVASPTSLKIRAFLSSPKPLKKVSDASSSSSSRSYSSSLSSSSSSSSRSATAGGSGSGSTPRYLAMPAVSDRCIHQMLPPPPPPVASPIGMGKSVGRNIPLPPRYACLAQGNHGHVYLIHDGNHWR